MAPYPPQPVNTIDWSNVGFKIREGEADFNKTDFQPFNKDWWFYYLLFTGIIVSGLLFLVNLFLFVKKLYYFISTFLSTSRKIRKIRQSGGLWRLKTLPYHLTTYAVAGHVESHYSVKTGKWTAPVFVEDPFLRIHGMAPGLNYGQQCYEGLKAFRAPDGKINIFRPQKNAERMQHSASYISIPDVPTDHFLECCKLAVGMNAAYVPPHETGAAIYVRPLLFGSSAQLGLNPPEEYTFVVYCIPTGVYHGSKPVDALILEHFDRAAPEGVGSAKVGGNYAPVLRWSEKAHQQGYGITLHLDSKTRSVIDEFSTSAFIGVKKLGDNKYKLVSSNSNNVIKSVTADSILQIAKDFGWEAESRTIPYDELKEFDEVLAAGTAAALVPIKSITSESKGDKFTFIDGSNEPGPVCQRLLTTLKGIQQGKIEDRFGWLVEVPKPALWDRDQSNGEERTVDEMA